MRYHIYLIANNLTYEKFYQRHISDPLIESISQVKPVYLEDCVSNHRLLPKLKTRYNTLIKTRLRKLGCIMLINALQKIVDNGHSNTLILEEDGDMTFTHPI